MCINSWCGVWLNERISLSLSLSRIFRCLSRLVEEKFDGVVHPFCVFGVGFAFLMSMKRTDNWMSERLKSISKINRTWYVWLGAYVRQSVFLLSNYGELLLFFTRYPYSFCRFLSSRVCVYLFFVFFVCPLCSLIIAHGIHTHTHLLYVCSDVYWWGWWRVYMIIA